jgi:hypothetical protein
MFLDLSTQYTETKISSSKAFQKKRNTFTSLYSSYTSSLKGYKTLQFSYSEPIEKKVAHIKTPENLKKAMFKMSSKNIGKVLNKKD